MSLQKRIGKGVVIEVTDHLHNPVIAGPNSALLLVKDKIVQPIKCPMNILITVIVDYTDRSRGKFYGIEQALDTHATALPDLSDDPSKSRFTKLVKVEGKYNKKGELVRSFVNFGSKKGLSHMKLLELYANGSFKVWEVGVTMRGDDFYLSEQLIWDERVYRDGGDAVIPALYKWGSLRKYILLTDHEKVTPVEDLRAEAEVRGEEFHWPFVFGEKPVDRVDLKNLNSVSKYKPRPEITAEGLGHKQGRVIMYNLVQGYGLLATTEGIILAHWSKVVGDPMTSFEKGEVVELDGILTTEDKDGGQKKMEAIGIRKRQPDTNASSADNGSEKEVVAPTAQEPTGGIETQFTPSVGPQTGDPM